MQFEPLNIADIILFTPNIHKDHRGFFLETFRVSSFSEHGIGGPFVQDNYSGSEKGVLRGLHYQLNHTQGKLISATVGSIFDVAVDVRKSSATFGQWAGAVLDAERKQQLWVPPGFAHGYYVLSDWAEISYKCTDYYDAASERTLLWNDAAIGVQWPLDGEPVLSEKDKKGVPLGDAEVFA
jgi:dTDP-4-dehydrorhamnose 3,5-epimerase